MCSKCWSCRHWLSFRWCWNQNWLKAFSVLSNCTNNLSKKNMKVTSWLAMVWTRNGMGSSICFKPIHCYTLTRKSVTYDFRRVQQLILTFWGVIRHTLSSRQKLHFYTLAFKRVLGNLTSAALLSTWVVDVQFPVTQLTVLYFLLGDGSWTWGSQQVLWGARYSRLCNWVILEGPCNARDWTKDSYTYKARTLTLIFGIKDQ